MRLAAKGWAPAWKPAEAFGENSSRKPRRGGAHPACGRWYTRKAKTRKQKLEGRRKKAEGECRKEEPTESKRSRTNTTAPGGVPFLGSNPATIGRGAVLRRR